MHAHLFDPYISIASPVHALDSRIKLALVVLFILGVALAPIGAWGALILYFATVFGTVILSGIPPLKILRRSVIALPFALAALPLVFSTAGVRFFSFPIGSWTIAPTYDGLIRFLTIAGKSWISVMGALILSSTTNFQELLLAMRNFRVPQLLVSIIGLMWRYLFVLADETIRLIRARDSRSGTEAGHRSGGGILWRAQVTGGMAGTLFVRGFDRADRVYAAMLARGYDGEIRALPAPPIPPTQFIILAAGIIWLALIALMGFFFR